MSLRVQTALLTMNFKNVVQILVQHSRQTNSKSSQMLTRLVKCKVCSAHASPRTGTHAGTRPSPNAGDTHAGTRPNLNAGDTHAGTRPNLDAGDTHAGTRPNLNAGTHAGTRPSPNAGTHAGTQYPYLASVL